MNDVPDRAVEFSDHLDVDCTARDPNATTLYRMLASSSTSALIEPASLPESWERILARP